MDWFPCGLAGKESTCNAGDPGLIPGLGRSPGERKGFPLQYSGLENSMGWFPGGSDGKASASMWETRVRSLGQKYPLEKEMATHSSTLAWKSPWMEEPGRL